MPTDTNPPEPWATDAGLEAFIAGLHIKALPEYDPADEPEDDAEDDAR